MVGILEHATFSNIRERATLYQDYLDVAGYSCQSSASNEYRDQDRGVFEFNIARKLTGSFEEHRPPSARSSARPS